MQILFPVQRKTLVLVILVIYGCTVSCSTKPSDLDRRLFAQLKSANTTSDERFRDDCFMLMRQFEFQVSSGIKFHAELESELKNLQMEYGLADSKLDRMMTFSENTISMADSVRQFLMDWAEKKRKFWTKDDRLQFAKDWNDSTEYKMIDQATSRFASSNAPFWETEMELMRAKILADASGELNYLRSRRGCIANFTVNYPDSLTFEASPEENSLEAGEEAKISLRVTQNVLHRHQPRYTGSGRIENNTDFESATMYLQTSEDMIPIGQKEAFVKYNAQAKVPKVDGEVATINLQGQIKIRRPCHSPSISPIQNNP